MRLVFDSLQNSNSGENGLGYDNIKLAIHVLTVSKLVSRDRGSRMLDNVWGTLVCAHRRAVDGVSSQEITIQKPEFLQVFRPCAYRAAASMNWTASTSQDPYDSSVFESQDSYLYSREFFKCMLKLAKTAKAEKTGEKEGQFQPYIHTRSRALAQVKEQRDRVRISQLRSSNVESSGMVANRIGESPSGDDDDAVGNNCESTASPGSSTSTDCVKHSDLMYSRHLLRVDSINKLREEREVQISRECSFRPTINRPRYSDLNTEHHHDTSILVNELQHVDDDLPPPPDDTDDDTINVSRISNTLPVHERLYSHKDRLVPINVQQAISVAVLEELQQCTFQPDLSLSRRYRPKHKTISHEDDSDTSNAQVQNSQEIGEDFLKAVNRMKQARLKRIQLLKESEEANGAYNDESYQRSRRLAAKGVAPFTLMTETRQQGKQRIRNSSSKPR